MEQIIQYVKPELLVVAIALYFLAEFVKVSDGVNKKYIPSLTGIVGILLCGIWVFATSKISTAQDTALALFTAIVQGLIVAGLSTYVHQFTKQFKDN